ncbi:MAG: Ig-like domain-containing protein [Gemmatimonadota bacterium]|nr:Ig-like domain-containing protein [Gemmatimonadota bacterium]
MPPRISSIRVLALVGIIAVGGCTRDLDTLGPAQFPTDAGVFAEGLASGVRFEAFSGAKPDAISDDPSNAHSGAVGLKLTVPAPGDPSGSYAGGAFIANVPRDLSGYNALTFWAKASVPASLDVAGLGNDNTGTSKYTAQQTAIALTTGWKKYTIPIPLAAKLTKEGGLFFFAEGPENGAGYNIWLDDIQFETVTTIQNPRPVIAPATVADEVGASLRVGGTSVTFAVEGVDQTLVAAPAYFTFVSSDAAVATVAPDGLITLVGSGSASITAQLGTTPATGAVTLLSVAPPAVAAPVPTDSAVNVISLYSNAYTNNTVDTWSAGFDQADVADVQIAGDDAKKYTNLVFAGIEFISQQVDATAMTGFHVDLFVQNAGQFKIKLVDFGANGAFGGGDDSEHEVTLTTSSSPAITSGSWSSLDIPFSSFPGLTSRAHLAQIIISGSSSTAYLDNVYFFKGSTPPPPTGPTVAAPTPTVASGSVISLYSNAYTNVTVDTWSAVWDNADVADVLVAGNDTKNYTNLVFAGIEFTSAPVDASTMTAFHMDIWTPDPTAAPAVFRVKLVDFGAGGVFGGGDDVEHELTFDATTSPALATGNWVGIDVPLSAFTGLVTRAHVAQIVISGTLGTLYVDNVYFYAGGSPPTSPPTPAPTPTKPAGNVISLYSNAYTNVTVDTWSAVWDVADVADVLVVGNDVKEYTNVVFAGIEFTSAPVDASTMTGFHMDIWTPDPTTTGAAFKVKLVDFGADGGFGGGDDVEQELMFTNASTPPLATGSWVGIDVPLSAFPGLVTKAHLAQMVISGTLSTFYIDNVYFYNSGGAPTLSSIAITPTPVNLAPAGTQQLTVTGTYSDASTANLTSGSTFVSSATGVATVSGSGLVTAVAVGTATITATHTASGLTAPVTVNVATGSGGGLVFFGGYDPGVSFIDFGGATNSVSIDAGTTNNGRSSFKAIITGSGGYSGGAFASAPPRDLSSFNALTFWAKGSTSNASLKVGIGNNGTGNLLNAEAIGIALTTTFTKYIIPLPDPSKFVGYDGLFHFADGPNNYTVWFNDIQYENLPVGQVGPPTAALAAWPSLTVAVGTPAQMNPAPNTVNWTVPALPNGGKLTDVAWRWFTLTSSNPGVATVSADGVVTGVSGGTANITATMNGIAVPGNAPITVTAPLGVPTNIAPTPTVNPANVISLFSSAYTNQGVDTWQTGWSTCCNTLVDPYVISGHDVKQYSLFNFVGVEFGLATPANTVNATTMTHFHVDVWSPNPSSNLEIQLVNDPGGPAQAIARYQAGAFASGTWVSLDIPLSSFVGLTAKDVLRQLLFVAAGPTVLYIDNVYFHN